MVAAMSAVIVRTVSADWSDERTWGWAESSILGVLFKLVVLDPIKVMCCCEALVGPLFAWLTGELSFDGDFDMDAAVEVLEDTIEARIEQYTGGSGLEAGAWAAGATDAARQAGTLQTNQAIFAVGGLGAAKFARKIEQSRNRREVRRQLDHVEKDNKHLEAKHQLSMARTSSIYAEKVRKKREAAGKMAGNMLDERARHAAQRAKTLEAEARARETASVSSFWEKNRNNIGSTPNDRLWKQAVDETATHRSNLELQRTASSAALQAKLDAKRQAAAHRRRERERRSKGASTLQGQVVSRPFDSRARTGKVDESSAAQPVGPVSAFGLSAVPSAPVAIPTFNHGDMMSEAELDDMIAGALSTHSSR
jgi:hypothetical protein